MTDLENLSLTDLHGKSQSLPQIEQSSLFKTEREMLQQQLEIVSEMQQSIKNMASDNPQEDFLFEKFKEAEEELSRSKLIQVQQEQELREKEKEVLNSASTIAQLQEQVKSTTDNYEVMESEFQEETSDLRKRLQEQTEQNHKMMLEISGFTEEAESSKNVIAQNEVVLADKLAEIASYQQELELAEQELEDNERMMLELENRQQSNEFDVVALKSSLELCEDGKKELENKYDTLSELMAKNKDNCSLKLKEMNDSNIMLAISNKEVEDQIQILQQRLNEVEHAKQQLITELDEGEKKHDHLIAQHNSLNGELERYKVKCDRLSKEKELSIRAMEELSEKADFIKSTTNTELNKLRSLHNAEIKRNEEFEHEIAKIEQEKNDFLRKNHEEESQIQSLQSELEILQEKYSQIEKSAALVADGNTKLVDGMRGKLADIELQRQELAEELTNVKQSLFLKESDYLELYNSHEAECDANGVLKFELLAASDELKEVSDDYRQAHSRKAYLESEITALNNAHVEAKADIEQSSEECKREATLIQEMSKQINNYAADNAKLKIDNENLDERVQKMDDLKNEVRELNESRSEATKELFELKEENKVLLGKMEYHFEEYEQVASKNAFLSEMLKKADTESRRQGERLEQLENIKSGAAEKMQVIDDLVSQNQKLNLNIEQLTEHRAKLEKELSDQKESNSALNLEIEQSVEDIAGLQVEIKTAEEEIIALRELKEELERNVNDNLDETQQLNETIGELTKKNAELAEQLVTNEEGCSRLEEQSKQLESQCDGAKNENIRLSQELAAISTEKAALLLQIADIAREKDDCAQGIEAEKEKVKEENEMTNSLDEQINALKVQLSDKAAENSKLRQEIQELDIERGKAIADSRAVDAESYSNIIDGLKLEIEGLQQEIDEYQTSALEKDDKITELTREVLEKVEEAEGAYQLRTELKTLEAKLKYTNETVENLIENNELLSEIRESDMKKPETLVVFEHAIESLYENLNQCIVLEDQVETSQSLMASSGALHLSAVVEEGEEIDNDVLTEADRSQFENKIEQLEMENTELQASLKAQVVMNEQLEREGLEKLNQEYLRRDNETKERAEIDAKVTEISVYNAELNDEIAEYEKVNAEQKDYVTTLVMQQNNDLQNEKDKVSSLKEHLDIANRQLEAVEGENSHFRQQIALLEETKEELSVDIDGLNEQIRYVSEKYEELQTDSESNAAKSKNIKMLSDSIIEELIEVKTSNELQRKQFQDDIAVFEQYFNTKLEELRAILKVHEESAISRKQTNDSHEVRIDELHAEIGELTSGIADLEAEKDLQSNENAVLRLQIQKITEELGKENGNVGTDFSAELAAAENALTDLQNQLAYKEEIIDKNSSYICKLETMKSEKEEELAELQQTKQHDDADALRTKETVAQLRGQISSLTAALNAKSSEIARLEQELNGERAQLTHSEILLTDAQQELQDEEQRDERQYQAFTDCIDAAGANRAPEAADCQKEAELIADLRRCLSQSRQRTEAVRQANQTLKGIIDNILGEK